MNIDIKDLLAKFKKKERGLDVGGNILIDLTPPSYTQIIETRNYGKRWIMICIYLAVICAVAIGLTYSKTLATELQLREQESEQSELDAQIAEYSDVNDVLVARDAAKRSLQDASGTEIDWNKTYSNIENALPGDTTIARMVINLNENSGSAVSAAVQVDLVAGSTVSYSDSLKFISDLEGVSSVSIGGLQRSGEDSYRFSMSFTYDTSIQSNRYNFIAGE